MNQEDLYNAARKGGRDAFEQLFDGFSHELRGFVAKRLGKDLRTYVEVDDILQETSLKAIEAIEQTQWQGSRALFNWFCGIALNTIYANSRRFLKMNLLPDGFDGADEIGPSPSQSMRREERFDRLERCLSRLSEDQQQVIRLTRIECLPVRQVAHRIGKTEKATYQILWRATKKLGEIFGDTASLQLPPNRNADILNQQDDESTRE